MNFLVSKRAEWNACTNSGIVENPSSMTIKVVRCNYYKVRHSQGYGLLLGGIC